MGISKEKVATESISRVPGFRVGALGFGVQGLGCTPDMLAGSLRVPHLGQLEWQTQGPKRYTLSLTANLQP